MSISNEENYEMLQNLLRKTVPGYAVPMLSPFPIEFQAFLYLNMNARDIVLYLLVTINTGTHYITIITLWG